MRVRGSIRRLRRFSQRRKLNLRRDVPTNGCYGSNARPHPGLLPQGEGELFAVAWRIERVSDWPSAGTEFPSPWGEGQGEGGRELNSAKSADKAKRKVLPFAPIAAFARRPENGKDAARLWFLAAQSTSAIILRETVG